MRALFIVPNAVSDASLRLSDVREPELGAGQVRIAVRAASVNRADLLARAGRYALAPGAAGPAIAGLDAAGDVVEVAPEVDGVSIGDRVMAMVAGGLAQEVVVEARMAVPIPDAWSYVEGAAAVLGLMTEHNALVTAGGFARGESVLVHAATSGVATQAIQLARYLGASTVIATARSSLASRIVEALGADELINSNAVDFADRVLELTDGGGGDVILDHVGGPFLERNLTSLALQGRLVGIGRLGGGRGSLDLEELARKRIQIVGVTFRTRSPEQKVAVVAELRADVDFGSAAVGDALRPLIHNTYDWADALDAHTELAYNTHVGKIVLTVT